jgi:hypothetical protein
MNLGMLKLTTGFSSIHHIQSLFFLSGPGYLLGYSITSVSASSEQIATPKLIAKPNFADQASKISLSYSPGLPVAFLNSTTLRYVGLAVRVLTQQWSTPGVSDGEAYRKPQVYGHEINLSPFLCVLESHNVVTWESSTQSLSVISENNGAQGTDWTIQRRESTNSVVLQLRSQEAQGEYLLTHLPRIHGQEQTYISLLRFSEHDRWVRLIWNKGHQESYSLQDPVNPYLPCIISRKPETIEYRDGGKKAIRAGASNSVVPAKRRLSQIWQ